MPVDRVRPAGQQPAQEGVHLRVVEAIAGEPPRPPVGHGKRDPVQHRAALRASPHPGQGDVVDRHQLLERARRRRDDEDLEPFAVERCGRLGATPPDRLERGDGPVGQGPELERLEQLAGLVEVRRRRAQRLDVHARDVAHQRRRPGVAPYLLLRRDEAVAQLRAALGDVLVDAVDAAVVVDQLGRRLLADPRDAGEVVARVAAERGVLRIQRRRDAGAGQDAGLVVERVVADAALVVEDADGAVGLGLCVLDELVAVPVAGDHHDVVTASLALRRQGGEHVVGLEPGELVDGEVEHLHDLADEAHLLAQDVGRLLAAGLVVPQHLVAETSARDGRT